MLTQAQLAQLVLRGRAFHLQLVRALTERERKGDVTYKAWNKAITISYAIEAVSFSLLIGDYVSDDLVKVYNNLFKCVGANALDNLTTDPNAQLPGGVIISTGGSTVVIAQANVDRIKFGEGGGVFTASLTDFQETYVAKYGDNAIVEVFVTVDNYFTMQKDTGTVPTIVNVGGDVDKPDSYTWTWAIPTTGYIQITGFIEPGNNQVSPPVTNNSDVLLSNATLNGLYPSARWGQLILLPNVPCKYLKLDDLPTGSWDYQIYSPND